MHKNTTMVIEIIMVGTSSSKCGSSNMLIATMTKSKAKYKHESIGKTTCLLRTEKAVKKSNV